MDKKLFIFGISVIAARWAIIIGSIVLAFTVSPLFLLGILLTELI